VNVPVLNRAPFTMCYMDDQQGEVILESGKWQVVPRDFALRRLQSNPHLLIDWGTAGQWDSLLPWPHLTLATPLGRWTGYGTVGEQFAHHLQGQLPYRLLPLGCWDRPAISSPIVQQAVQASDGQDGHPLTQWALCITIPPELPRVPSPRRLLFSMWETGILPNSPQAGGNWAELTNRWAVALIVPCASQAEMWKRAGVAIPIHTCPLGVSQEFHYRERPPRPQEAPFTILHYGLLTSRKAPIETIQTCWRALGQENDWRLILKTRAGQLGAGAFTPLVSDERITVINDDYTPQQMADLCTAADLGLFLSKYEGYGLPPREMMASGLPVIWSKFSGHLEDCNDHYNIPIPIVRIIGANEGYAGMGGWGEPDWAAAAAALRRAYDDWKARGRTQSEMGRRAAAWISGRCDWQRSTRRLLEIIKETINGSDHH